jgi:hypothetical protein
MSSGNGRDPETYCTTCSSKIRTDSNGLEHGHKDWCEWNPNKK